MIVLLARRVRWAACLGAVVLLAAGCGSSSFESGDLHAISHGGVGAAITVKPGVPYAFSLKALCTSGNPVHITAVTPRQVRGHIKVVDWGIRLRTPRHTYEDVVDANGLPDRVKGRPGFNEHRPVTAACDQRRDIDDMDVSIALVGTGRSVISGFDLHYDDGETAFSQYRFILCSSKPCDTPD